jgi:RND family efflux transporter MFP subunit
MNKLLLNSVVLQVFLLATAAIGIAAENKVTSDLATNIVELNNVDNLQLFDGVIEAVNRSTISAQTSARIVRINFDVDDFVKAGEIILQFGDGEHKARLAEAESALRAAIAARTGAQQEFKRIEMLFARGAVAKARLDDAQASFEVSKARVQAAMAALEQAREQLGYTIVRAPYSGIVVERHVQIGEFANPGQPLMTGFSLENLRARVAVPQQFANLIRRENRAVIFDGSGGSIAAETLTVFPYADEKSNTVTIRATLAEGTDTVFPGMLVKVAFKTGSRKVLSIPDISTVNRGEVIGVYLFDENGSIHLQQIRTGRSMDGRVEVLSGLKEGDRIAADPYKALLALKSSDSQ